MITDLHLQHFRSYEDESFEFRPGVNIIVGPNASGKTNLLESILVVATGTSYRAKDGELVHFEQPWARIDSREVSGSERSVKLLLDPLPGKSYEVDGKPYQRLTLAHTLPVVLFEPDHLQLLTGSPDRRRNYLDDLLEQTRVGYGSLRRAYKRTLAQRNALLKSPGPLSHTQLFPWNVRLSELAGQIVRLRIELVDELAMQLTELYQELAHSTANVGIRYEARWPAEAYESHFLKKLESSAAVDAQRGFTSSGPHREDFVMLYDGHPAALSASRGETRTGVLALKVMELQIIEKARGETPLLLLDDVFSELDGARRRALTEHLSDYQTFITTTDADIVVRHFTETAHVIPLDRES